MHAAHDVADLGRLAQGVVGGAQGVVEHDDAQGAALGLHQSFHLRVVDAADLFLVVEIADLRVVTDKAEAFPFQAKTVRIGPTVADDDPMRVRLAAAGPRVPAAGRRHQRDRLQVGVEKIVESRFDRFRSAVEFGELRHGASFACAGRAIR
ncbi:MAG TPA: hypothetical protein VE993_14610 [Stellaceae bacterium]|nr:hypothetical protein [Stellaceae bacterium]